MTTQRPLYHRFAGAFGFVVPDARGGRVRRRASLLRSHGVRPPARVLDAGCGTGNYARSLARHGYRVVGVDRSAPLLAAGRARHAPATAGPTFRRADLTTYRPTAPFAAVLCRGVLNDVLGGRERDAVCVTLARALAPGGILLLDVRDWKRTAARKRAEPATERTTHTARGRLAFRSDTRLGPAGVGDGLGLELHLRLETFPRGLVEQPLGAPEGLRRPLRELARQRLDRALEFRVGHGARDQAPVLRLARGQHAVGEVELHRTTQADEPRQEVRRRAVGRGRDLRVRHRELRRLRRDHQISRARQAQSAAGGDPVDGHDHRLVAATEARDGAVQVRRQLLDQRADTRQVLGEGTHVAAGAERLAAAGDDDAAHVRTLVEVDGGREQLASEPEVQRVVRVGAIERDGGDVRGALDDQVLEGHGLSSGAAGGALRAASARASRISWICRGLPRTTSTPCARRSSGDSSTPKPVTSSTGTCGACCLTARATCKPETRGIARSVSTMSNGSARNRAIASAPSSTTVA